MPSCAMAVTGRSSGAGVSVWSNCWGECSRLEDIVDLGLIAYQAHHKAKEMLQEPIHVPFMSESDFFSRVEYAWLG